MSFASCQAISVYLVQLFSAAGQIDTNFAFDLISNMNRNNEKKVRKKELKKKSSNEIRRNLEEKEDLRRRNALFLFKKIY